MKKGIWIIAIVILVGLTGFFFARRGNLEGSAPAADGEALPEIQLQTYDGKPFPLADLKGKPAVINAWATWCPFCKEELPAFGEAKQKFGDKIAIVAIDRAESLKDARAFSDGVPMGAGLIWLLDPNDSFYRSIGGFSMPETIFVDQNGVIKFHKRGPMDAAEIASHIEDLLK